MHRWKLSALAAAAATLSLGIYSSDASALALGRLSVKSALGEPLRAEIDVPQITTEEADSLRTQPASAEVFRTQGVEFSPLMNGVQIVLKRRPDGSAFLLVTSSRTVNDPFLDLVIDASWSAGRLVRNYTILLDPPASRRAPPEVTAAAQLPAPVPQTAPQPALQPAPPSARAAAEGTGSNATPGARTRARAQQAPAASTADAGGVTVRPGDTASRIAQAHRPASVSLDQMIVALLRSNPNAFIHGNANRIKAGAVLQLPDEAAAQSVAPAQARQILAAQSRDFSNFRRKLAAAAPQTDVAPAQRAVSGSVQAVVEDKKPAGAGPDKLLLSKNAAPGQKSAEDQLAKEKQARETSTRVAELSQNIAELNKLSAASAGSAGSAAAAAASAAGTPSPVAPVATPQAAASGAAIASAGQAPAAPASAASAAAPTASAAPIAAASAPASRPKPAPAPAPESSFVSGLLEEPLLPAAGGLAVLLLGYGAYRVVQQRRKKESQSLDSSFMESRLPPDSFFGASGGQRVDTANSDLSTGASSMAYSPSQLDVVGDIDPVAEADVYLAYGRDLQAEEILREALRHHPERVPVHVKLGEIYAKRQDRKALEAVAAEVFKLTQGEGPDWARIAELGRALEPVNALYQPGSAPRAAEPLGAASSAVPSPPSPSTFPSAFPSTFPGTVEAVGAALPELDLNLDLDTADAAHTASPATPAPVVSDSPVVEWAAPLDVQKDAFDLAAAASEAAAPADADLGAEHFPAAMAEPAPAPAEATAEAAPPQPTLDAEPMLAELDFSTDGLDLLASAPMPLKEDAQTPTPEPLEFDLGDLSLDLGSTPASAAAPAPTTGAAAEPPAQDPLATKLALAQEFHSIGDTEGARELIEEVLAEASGPLKERAQRLLSEIG